jgi:hypothetical protein
MPKHIRHDDEVLRPSVEPIAVSRRQIFCVAPALDNPKAVPSIAHAAFDVRAGRSGILDPVRDDGREGAF